jgi:Flp pilus assembly protein TadD
MRSSRPPLKTKPTSGPRSLWREELERGSSLLRAGKYEPARARFMRAHALAPEQAEPALALGRLEWRLGHLADAERFLRLAYRARPDWPLAAAALARLYFASDDPRRRRAGARVLGEARRRTPDHPALLVVVGEQALERGRPKAARQAFVAARAVGADPEVVRTGLSRAENAIGLSLATARRTTEAAFAFKRAADLDATWSSPHVNLGTLLQRLGRLSPARTQYERALELEPGNPTAHFNLGLLHRQSGDLGAAERAFAAALDAEPPHPHSRRELALTLADRGRLDRAVALFEEELQLVPSDASAVSNLREALRRLAQEHATAGRLLEGAACLRRAKELGNLAGPPASK